MLGSEVKMQARHNHLAIEQGFERQLARFLAAAQEVCDENGKRFENVPRTVLSIDPKGRKYARIVADSGSGQRFVHCFVDKGNGDVLKAAGWKGPAKHARGNIFDDDCGASAVGPYGANYIR